MQRLVAEGVALLVLEDHRARVAVEGEVKDGRALVERVAQLARADLEGRVVLAPIDHAGHEALAAQPSHGPGALRHALLHRKLGSLCLCHDGAECSTSSSSPAGP